LNNSNKLIVGNSRKEETEEEKAQRLAKWADFLSKDDQEEDE